LKTLVLDSVSSPITKRVYNMALDAFLQWFQQALRRGFTKATVSAWRVSLEARWVPRRSLLESQRFVTAGNSPLEVMQWRNDPSRRYTG